MLSITRSVYIFLYFLKMVICSHSLKVNHAIWVSGNCSTSKWVLHWVRPILNYKISLFCNCSRSVNIYLNTCFVLNQWSLNFIYLEQYQDSSFNRKIKIKFCIRLTRLSISAEKHNAVLIIMTPMVFALVRIVKWYNYNLFGKLPHSTKKLFTMYNKYSMQFHFYHVISSNCEIFHKKPLEMVFCKRYVYHNCRINLNAKSY